MGLIPALSERTWKIVGVCVLGLVVIGGVLLFADKCSDWRFNSKQDKLKANVNAALVNIEERSKVIANLKEQQAAETEAVKRDAKEYLEAQGATDAAKAETDKAIANLANAAKANGNVSVKELEEKLRGL